MFRTRELGRLGPGLLVAAAGAAAFQLAGGHSGGVTAHCEVPSVPKVPLEPPQPTRAVQVSAMKRWLEKQGADVQAIDFKASPADAGRFGVFVNAGVKQKARRGWWGTLKVALGRGDPNVALASFPLAGALTASSILQQGTAQVGLLKEMAELGVVDERTIVMLHLLVERLREKASPLCPWLTLLPRSFDTTLFFTERELGWLQGTTLHKATMLRRRALEEQWRRLEPAAAQLALQEGAEGRPSFQDYLWAYSVFWSRAITFPCPLPGGGVGMEEGVVPGLDFCNHAAASPARWTVFGAADKPGKELPSRVTLICPRNALPKPGQEVTINYGGKSNEELLFLYGFALENNPDDVLMVACPVPSPADWDDRFRARMQLLQLRGDTPQLFLPAAFLATQREREAAAQAPRRRWWGRRRRAAQPGAGQPGAAAGLAGVGDDLGADLPEGVFSTLEVFVMEGRQLNMELARHGEGGNAAAGAEARGRRELSPTERSGLRMAVLTTLVRLLELKVLAQEGEEGTGSLEMDQQLLEAASKDGAGSAAGGSALSARERHALLYRMGQKALTRDYLLYAKRLLEREMQTLRVLMGSPNAES